MEADWKSGVQTYYQKMPNGGLKKCKSLKAVVCAKAPSNNNGK